MGDESTGMSVRLNYTVRQRYGGSMSHRDSIQRPQQRREYDPKHVSKVSWKELLRVVYSDASHDFQGLVLIYLTSVNFNGFQRTA